MINKPRGEEVEGAVVGGKKFCAVRIERCGPGLPVGGIALVGNSDNLSEPVSSGLSLGLGTMILRDQGSK